MNKVSGWILRLRWVAVLVSILALPAYAQLMIGHMGHGGGGDCNISEPIPLNYSVYEKPKGQLPPSHAFCKHVPNTGEHIVTIDLQGSESREMPIGIRLVLTEGGQNRTVMSTPSQPYPSGSITLAVNLKELGQYNLLLETEKNGNVTLPLHVGEGGGHGGHSGVDMLEIILLLGAAGGIAAFFWLRRKPNKDTEEESTEEATEESRQQ